VYGDSLHYEEIQMIERAEMAEKAEEAEEAKSDFIMAFILITCIKI